MDNDYINLTVDNLPDEHISCIIRSKKGHSGIDAKKQWLSQRLKEGHVFRKLNAKGTAFTEYAPLETAWVPVLGDNYLYIYCLWVTGEFKGKGHAKALMEYCLSDAKAKGRSGVCMLGAKKQKAWLSNQDFAKKYGFQTVDTTDDGYELLALSFDGSTPRFAPQVKTPHIDAQELTVYFSGQCPFVPQSLDALRQYCQSHDLPLTLNEVDTLEKAKALPCVFNNYAVFYKGAFQTVNLLLDMTKLERMLRIG